MPSHNSEKSILSQLVLLNLIILLLLIISIPFSLVPVSLGLYITWQIVHIFPIYVALTLGIRELFLFQKLPTLSKKSMRPFFRGAADIVVIQLGYSIILIVVFNTLSNSNKLFAMFFEWFGLLKFDLVIHSSGQIYDFFLEWLNIWEIPSTGIFIIPPILAFAGFLFISIPFVYLVAYAFSLIENSVRK